jgi:glycosyltransferase involved in cell wall biosynthesis
MMPICRHNQDPGSSALVTAGLSVGLYAHPAASSTSTTASTEREAALVRRRPLITLITPCLNARAHVADMLASVHGQYASLEHIVLEGGSTDGTREILAGWPDIRLVQEPDAGSHDAMNKGLRLARGDIIAFVNADDLYAPGILDDVVSRFAAQPELDALLGRSYVFELGTPTGCTVAEHALGRAGGFDLDDLMYGIPCINARFFHRRVFDRVGGFDLAFSFAADRHFLLRLALSGVRGAVLDRPAYYYRRHAASRTLDPEQRNAAALTHEHIAIAEALLALPDTLSAHRALRAWRAYECWRERIGNSPACTWTDMIRAAVGADQKAAAISPLLRGGMAKLRTIQRRRRAPTAGPPAHLLPEPLRNR